MNNEWTIFKNLHHFPWYIFGKVGLQLSAQGGKKKEYPHALN